MSDTSGQTNLPNKRFWNSDKILSFTAILISLLTLVVFLYQTNLMRKQQLLSVLPYLAIGNYGLGTSNFTLVLQNDGIGPAFIEDQKIIYLDSTYHMDLPGFLYAHVPAMDSLSNISYSNIYPGKMIPPNEKIELLRVNESIEDELKLLRLLEALEIDYEIHYRSIYNERWVLRSGETSPQKK